MYAPGERGAATAHANSLARHGLSENADPLDTPTTPNDAFFGYAALHCGHEMSFPVVSTGAGAVVVVVLDVVDVVLEVVVVDDVVLVDVVVVLAVVGGLRFAPAGAAIRNGTSATRSTADGRTRGRPTRCRPIALVIFTALRVDVRARQGYEPARPGRTACREAGLSEGLPGRPEPSSARCRWRLAVFRPRAG